MAQTAYLGLLSPAPLAPLTAFLLEALEHAHLAQRLAQQAGSRLSPHALACQTTTSLPLFVPLVLQDPFLAQRGPPLALALTQSLLGSEAPANAPRATRRPAQRAQSAQQEPFQTSKAQQLALPAQQAQQASLVLELRLAPLAV